MPRVNACELSKNYLKIRFLQGFWHLYGRRKRIRGQLAQFAFLKGEDGDGGGLNFFMTCVRV